MRPFWAIVHQHDVQVQCLLLAWPGNGFVKCVHKMARVIHDLPVREVALHVLKIAVRLGPEHHLQMDTRYPSQQVAHALAIGLHVNPFGLEALVRVPHLAKGTDQLRGRPLYRAAGGVPVAEKEVEVV